MTKKNKPLSHDKMVKLGKISRKSKRGIESPVKACWYIFDEMKAKLGENLTRKAAMDAALARGIAFYTVRTQWQEWKQAGDRTRVNQAKFQPAIDAIMNHKPNGRR